MASKDIDINYVAAPRIRTPFDDVADKGVFFSTPSLTMQEFAEETNIHNIINRYERTGLWSTNMARPTRMPTFDDFTQVPDLLTAQKQLVLAKESFMSLPSDVRAEFHNDPVLFLKAFENPENRDKLIKLGLVVDKAEQSPLDVTVPTDTPLGSVPKKEGEKNEI